MALTRFYFVNSGTSPLPSLAIDSAWDKTATTFFRAPMTTSKSGDAIATQTASPGSTATQQMCFAQYVSPPFSAFTGLGTRTKFVIRCSEYNAAYNAWLVASLRVVNGTGSTVRTGGGIDMFNLSQYEMTTSLATQIGGDGNNIPSISGISVGDRFVLELGVTFDSPSANGNISLSFGAPVGSTDCAWVRNYTAANAGWYEFQSADFTFGAEASGAPKQAFVLRERSRK